jgi:DeoR/GlpR family transcriptional regulator of sugar metabolism
MIQIPIHTTTPEAGTVLAQERRMRILELLQEEGSARVSYLSAAFGVSEPTVRQDLERLEQEGQIVREHGGAYLRSVSSQVRSLSLQHIENMEKKAAIARRAAEFINDGDRLILDSGSTVTEISKLLKGHKDLTLVTNALNIALIVGAEYGFELIVTGGEFKAPTLSLTGPKAQASLENVFVDKLFLATGGISANLELTYPGLADLPVKRAMIEAASTVYLVADSTKVGKRSFASLGSMQDVDVFITDDGIDAETVKAISDLGVSVVIADQ